MKSEPDVYSITDLASEKNQTAFWEGVRNYQARNFMRDEMKIGDQALFYHSNCKEPGVVGVMTISREAYPDFTATDIKSPYYHAKSVTKNNWVMVDVTLKEIFKQTVSLNRIKETKSLQKMRLVQKGNRLSIMPVSSQEFDLILKLGQSPTP